MALAPSAREARAADELVEASIDLAGPARLLRQWIPSRANWARHAAERAGFERVRTVYHMLRPADASPLEARPPDGVRIRPIRPGEEARVLAALNRNWSTTWGFVPIRLDQLREDLEGQAEGMLLGVDAADEDRIIATCHAIFDPTDQNPDGHPRAWISNLTVDPDQRGRGLGRLLLAAALAHLRQGGAGSITLGVDGGNETPLKLYRSAGFDVISSIDAWDRQLADEQRR